MRYLIVAFLLFALKGYTQSTVENIPNQKLIDGSYVSDPDGILTLETKMQINSILTGIENTASAQIAVVAVQSIGDEDVFDFAQNLFEKWGIGQKSNDNGMLILLVKDKRVIRFHTGYGLEGVLPDIICLRIQREYMVPEFKKDDYDAGMLEGIKEVQKILTDPVYASELKGGEAVSNDDYTGFIIFLLVFCLPVAAIIYFIKSSNGRFSDSRNKEHTEYPEMRQSRWRWIIQFAGIPLLIVILFGLSSMENSAGACFAVLYLYFMITIFNKLWRMKKVINRFRATADYYQIVQFIRSSQAYWFLMAVLFPIPFAPYFFYHLGRKRIYRNHSRKCQLCQGAMNKLNEQEDDAYLTKSQLLEEELRSVDYDVWKCLGCEATQEWNYPSRYSKYKECPSCKTKAYHFVSRKTLVSATYSSSGSGEEIHSCKYCKKTKKTKYSISQLTRSSSSSGSSSFGSSSSSGGSWGGGSSGGGGASSSW